MNTTNTHFTHTGIPSGVRYAYQVHPYGDDRPSTEAGLSFGRSLRFLKINQRGQMFQNQDYPYRLNKAWSCILDVETGLLWEIKTRYSSASHIGERFTNNTGFNLHQTGNCNTVPSCQTESFVRSLSALNLCGHNDWRLPNIAELTSIVDDRFSPALDPEYFRNTGGTYWTSESHPTRIVTAYLYDFNDNVLSWDTRDIGHRARLVADFDLSTLQTPGNLKVYPGNDFIDLTWDLVPGAYAYRVYHSTSPDIDVDTPFHTSYGTSYRFSDLNQSTSYYFAVSALTDAGELAMSDVVSGSIDNYTKLDENGMPLADQSLTYAEQPWRCVQDNKTGLIWEVKTDDGGIHDNENTYINTAYYPHFSTSNIGLCDDPSGDRCNTQTLVDEVNAEALCGYTDWRMPTLDEMQALVKGGTENDTFNPDYFPYIPSLPGNYHTMSPYINLSGYYFKSGNIHAVTGYLNTNSVAVSSDWHVILVR
jgi:hypothetical protein